MRHRVCSPDAMIDVGAHDRGGAARDCRTFPFAVAATARSKGLRLAHLDEGEGAPVVFIHGEPTWSFLWRKVIPPVRDAGFRCIAPDLAGFGRSDKPTDIDFYTYDRHVELAATLLEDLDLRGATIVVHDWGGPIGLRLAVEQRERIERHRDPRHRPLHGPPEDDRRVDRLPRLRRAHRGPARRDSRAGRLQDTTPATR